MARPIRNTPTLYGDDAQRFLNDIAHLPPIEERQKERERIQQSVDDFIALVANYNGEK